MSANHIYPRKKFLYKEEGSDLYTIRELEYIEATGSQYFYTGINASFNLRIEYDIEFYETGGQIGSGALLFGLNQIEGDTYRYIARVGKGGTVLSVGDTAGRHKFILDAPNNKFIIDGSENALERGTTPDTTNIPISARRDGTTDSYFVKGKIYRAKFYENDVLVRDFIPAEKLYPNKIGMYDKVNKKFYPPRDSTGDFNSGGYPYVTHIYKPRIKAKIYEELEYIESSGTQYIDPNITEYSNKRFSLEVALPDTTKTFNLGFLGGSDPYQRFHFSKQNGSNYFQCGLRNYIDTNLQVQVTNNFHTLSVNTETNNFLVDTKFITLQNTGELPEGSKFLLFARGRTNGTIDYSHCRIKSFTYQANNSTVAIKYLVPVKRLTDNVYGMYDKTNKVFYENLGTGTFTGASKTTPTYIEDYIEQVDYIESNGTQYIDTNVKPSTTKIFETIIQFTDVSGGLNQEFGVYIPNDKRFHFGYRNNKSSFYAGMGNTYYDGDAFGFDTNKHKFTLHTPERRFYLDKGTEQEKYYNLASGSIPTANDFYLFARNDENIAVLFCKVKLYSHKVWDNNILIQDLVPVKYNNVYCLVDKLSGLIYPNSGTGTFTGGTRTEVKKITELAGIDNNGVKYGRLDYIESNGTQYIDTNFKGNQNTKYEIDLIQTALGGYPFGGANSWLNAMIGYYYDSEGQYGRYVCYGNQRIQATWLANTIDIRVKIMQDKGKVYFNGTLKGTMTANNFQSDYNLILMAYNSGNSGVSSFCSLKLYGFKLWDNGTLIRDFVPAQRLTDNVKGLYDVLNKTFYANAGTGEFSGNLRQITF